MKNMVLMLWESTGVETAYMYWVNRSREQFVLETSTTALPNVMFRDRIGFEHFFLDEYKDQDDSTQLQVGKEVPAEGLIHYFDFVPIKHITLLPFKNNGEVVAFTVLETEQPFHLQDFEETIGAYRSALLHILNTYLELTDLHDDQQQWTQYEAILNTLSPKQHKVVILERVMDGLRKILPDGGFSIMLRGMDSWITVFSSDGFASDLPPGLMLQEKSMAYDALQKGKEQFSIHFNQSPKRVSTLEKQTEGATYAVPMLLSDRRHAVVVTYHKNPLLFTESVKHKISNLVRVASLAIHIHNDKLRVDQDLFTSEYGSFIPEVWEAGIQQEIDREKKSRSPLYVGMITIQNLQEHRSRYRLEELKQLQKRVVKVLNPALHSCNGYIGFVSDYVFLYVLHCSGEQQHKQYMNSVTAMFEKPIELGNGAKIDIDILCGYTELEEEDCDAHGVVEKTKRAMSDILKSTA